MEATLTRAVQSTRQVDPPMIAGDFYDCDATLVFNYVLAPYQTLTGLQQPVDSNGDFWLCGIQASCTEYDRVDLTLLSTQCGIRVSDDVGYKLMSDLIPIGFFTPIYGNSYPYVVRLSHMFKMGTKIVIDLQEQSGVTAIVQIAFRGRYRYRMSDIQAARKQLIGARKSF